MKISFTARLGWLLWVAAFSLFIGIWLYPLSSTFTRAAGVLMLVVVWGGLLGNLWRWRMARYGLLGITLLCAVFLLLPGRSGRDTMAMRGDFTAGLRRYEGSTYNWGGESPKGIDCSGLIRRGMIDGMFLRGVRTFDPALVRWSLWLWWHDCSAKDLGNGNGMTTHLFDTPQINVMDHSRLLPGDIAVSSTGVHVMAYLGNNTWIEADPGVGRVITVKVPSDNPWFRDAMKIMRWDILQ